jgi:hypothetical protein
VTSLNEQQTGWLWHDVLCCVFMLTCCVCELLQDITNAASEENMDIVMPAHLNRIDKVSSPSMAETILC